MQSIFFSQQLTTDVSSLQDLSAEAILRLDAEGNPVSPDFYSLFATVNNNKGPQESALRVLQNKKPHEIARYPLYEEADL